MFKKILCISCVFLLMLGFVQFGAEAVQSDTVLVKENGVIINVSAKSVPGAKVAIMFLKPGSDEVDNSNIDAISYLGQTTADENGDVSETFYIPEGTGNHTLKMSNCFDVSYAVSRVSYEFFATSWSAEYKSKYIFPFYRIKLSDCAENVTENGVTTRVIDEEKIKASAENAKAYFEDFPEGKRYMIIWQELIHIIDDNAEDYLWWDVSELKAYMDSFFSNYLEIGGELDGVVCDFEPTPRDASNLKLISGKLEQAGGDKFAPYKDIQNNPLYVSEIRPELVKRDFVFSDNSETELYNIYTSPWSVNSLKWNMVVAKKRAEYLDEAVFDIVLKYFPDAKCSAYGFSKNDSSHKLSANSHKVYKAGKSSRAGTHSSFSLYGSIQSNVEPQYMQVANLDQNGKFLRNPFTLLKYDVNRARAATLADENGFMPWVANYDYADSVGAFGQTPYYYEMIFHVGLLDPDVYLYWGPKYNNESYEYVTGQAEKLNDCLEELDIMAGFEGRESLVETLQSWNTDFILSGMKSNGRNIWRITPNLEITDENGDAVYTIEGFCTDKENPTFKISGTEITFSQGKIIENPWSIASYGYWVETPENIFPNVNYDSSYYTPTDVGFTAEIEVFDNETGMNKSYLSDDVTVRVSYQNLSGDMKSAVVFAVGYTDGNEQMVFIHKIFDGEIAFGEDGYKLYRINKMDESVKKLKLFLWNGGDDLIPLGEAIELEKTN